ncbi:MAG TPA: coenzyme F420-0:L-glutamate ligase [Candidatus Acidoferrales bacterium]|nr:coenzyme F420-0:L-glutamate ligase [Candidatus Acidoferrales bacterium]
MKRKRHILRATASKLELFGLRSLPEVRPGDDLARLVADAARREGLEICSGDVVVLAQKIVSKAEGRIVRLNQVKASETAREWAKTLDEDARFLEVVLRESRRVVRMTERVLLVETHHGFTCANAGVDRSNVPGKDCVTCLPRNPDRSASKFIAGIRRRCSVRVAAVISDTFGRPWRLGLTNVAIGAAGLQVLRDLRGARDATGHRLRATVLATADDLAAAAGLLMEKRRGVPVVLIRGYAYKRAADSARRLIRPANEDLFR